MKNFKLNNIFWMTLHTIVLTSLVVILANVSPETYIFHWYGASTDTFLSTNNKTRSHLNTTNFSLSNPRSTGSHLLQDLFGGHKLSSRALVQNLPLLNGLYVGILSAMGVHVVLFFFQMWKPFRQKEDTMTLVWVG